MEQQAEVRQVPSSAGRRRLFRGVSGGVLLAVQAKTALGTGSTGGGGNCKSPSAMISGNTSPRPGSGSTCSGGRSPGFWIQPQKSPYWTVAGGKFPTFNIATTLCSTNLSTIQKTNITDAGTLLTTIFPGANVPAGTSLWSALSPQAQFGQLLRHLTAAWLNAGYFTSTAQDYPLTQQQVIQMWEAVKNGGEYCPSSLISCGNKGMSATEVISYIEQMYDTNSDISTNLCKVAAP